MKRLLAIVSFAASTGLLVYFFFITNTLDRSVLNAFAEPNLIGAIFAGALFYSLVIPISAWAWTEMLAEMGEEWRLSSTVSIMGVTQLAKYVPGNIAQHISRAALAMAQNMSPGVYAATVFFETLLAVIAGLMVGMFFWLLSGQTLIGIDESIQFRGVALLLILVLLGAGGIVILKYLSIHSCRFNWNNKWLSAGMRAPGPWLISRVLIAYSLNYVLIGFCLLLLSIGTGAGSGPGYFYLTATFAFAWLIGFFAPGLPAGFGAREAAMVLMLVGKVADEHVPVLIVGMRLVTIIGDLLSYIVGYVLLQKYYRRQK